MRSPSPRRALVSLLATVALLVGGLGAQATTDALHYRLEIELDFTARTISGVNHATYKSLVDNLTQLDLDLYRTLTVSKVEMNTKTVTFTRPTDIIRVTLDRAYMKDEQFTLDITYSGTPPSGGGFAFITHSGAAMAWTLSEPWDAKHWWPGKDILVDKSTFEMWITHPDTMTAASNGTLQGKDALAGNRTRSRFKETYPIVPYLVSLAVTNYQTRTDTYDHLGDKMPVEFYVFPENWSSWQSGMNLLVPMLKAFSNVYGQYPFVKEKYGIAQFTWGGGMEHQTITSQSSVTEWLSAHELSHQWWGDAITCATWHDIWLNEGFATFSEAVWEEQKNNGSITAYHSWIRQRRPTQYSGTVYCYDISNSNNIFNSNYSYRKGGWVLHQLRRVLGDKTFFDSLLAYRKAYEGGSATTDDFRQVCEQTAGRGLRWFFDEWVMNGGAPAYSYGWRTASIAGSNWLLFELDQTQSTPSLFTMPVDVRVTTGSGNELHVVWDDERQDQMAVRLGAPAQSITVDPDQWILRQSLGQRAYSPPFFAAFPESIDVAQGGDATFVIDDGTSAAGRLYFTLLGVTGSKPGTRIGSLLVPLNFDPMTDLVIAAVNLPVFSTFLGQLDANGMATSTLRLPAGLALPLKGQTLTACHVLVDRLDFASRPVTVELR